MKIPQGQDVRRALKSLRTATKKALKSLNRVAGERMSKGDYEGAEALATKGREVRQFVRQVDDLTRAWEDLSRPELKSAVSKDGQATPLWAYYQPILRAIVAAGGSCRWEDLEGSFEQVESSTLRPADRRPMAGGRQRWQVMIRRARKPLKSEGWIEKSGRLWVVTDAGRKVAAKESRSAPERPR
jgi:hypothetical protein